MNTSCSLHFSEILCGNRILSTSLGTKLTFFIFLVPWLCFPLELSRVRLWCLRLFGTCFHAKICSKCNFSSHCNVHSSTILTESLNFWNNFRITVNSRSSLLQKLNMSFLYIILSYHFYLGYVLIQKFRRHWNMRCRKNSQKRKCKVYCNKLRSWI